MTTKQGETKDEKKQRILKAMKFLLTETDRHPQKWHDLYPFHDPALYDTKAKWKEYESVMKNFVLKNPVYLYVNEVQKAKTIEELRLFESDHARYYYNSEHDQKLFKNGTYNYIEGLIAYSFHTGLNRQIMVFGEEHTQMRCTSSLQIFGAKPIPYLHVLHHILTTQASAKHPIDVFIERDYKTAKNLRPRISIDDVFLYFKTHFRHPLQQIDALYGKNVLPHVRFHWVDVRHSFPFLKQMLHTKDFLEPKDPNNTKDPETFENILKTYIQPLTNPNGHFLEALFVQVGIRKQLDKITNRKLSLKIETYFKHLIISEYRTRPNETRKIMETIDKREWKCGETKTNLERDL